jgi:hypothetical protein
VSRTITSESHAGPDLHGTYAGQIHSFTKILTTKYNPNPPHSHLRLVGSLRFTGSSGSIRWSGLHHSSGASSFIHPGVVSSSAVTAASSIALPITSCTQTPTVSKIKQLLHNKRHWDEAYPVIIFQALHAVGQPMFGPPLPHKFPSYRPMLAGISCRREASLEVANFHSCNKCSQLTPTSIFKIPATA